MFSNHNKTITKSEFNLLFLCNYKYKETKPACCLPAICGAYVGKRDEDHCHQFSNITQLTSLFDKYHDKYRAILAAMRDTTLH